MLVPKLRFKREDGTEYPEWEQYRLEDTVDFLDEKRKPITSKYRKAGQYPYYGASGIIDFIDDYIFDEELVLLSEDGANIVDRNYRVAFIATGKYWVNNHAHCLRPKQGFASYFISEALESIDYTVYNTGSAQPKLNQEVCRNLPLMCPCLEEQKKIADFLSTVDEMIAQSEAEVQNLEQQKKAAMQKIFSQEVRFKREDGTDYPAWEEKVFTDLFKSIPNKDYQVQTKEYKPNGKYRIIDQSQSFIAGYSDLESKVCYQNPCIIFGDHTTILKYVDFPFIVGADGVKTLITNDCYVAKYCFYLLGFNNVKPTGYNRHYSKLKELTLLCSTDIEEQQKIANFLSAYDEAISYAKQELDRWKDLKKGLLQQMFV